MASVFDWLGNEVFGTGNRNQINAAKASLDEVLSKAEATSAQNKALYDQYMSQMNGIYGNGAGNYSDAVKRLSDAIGNAPAEFTATGSVNDFYDPYANQRQAQAMDAINASASSGGSRFSSSYNDKLAAKQQALASEEWTKAFDKWMSDRNRQLQEWQAGQTAQQNYLGNLGTMAGLYGNDRDKLAGAIGDYNSAIANQNNANLETYADIASSKANLEAQKSNGMGELIGNTAKLAGALFL